jgi:hypothetical protein
VASEADGVIAGSDIVEAGNGMWASAISSNSDAGEGAPTLNVSTSGSSGTSSVEGASEGILSKSLGYTSAVMYGDLSDTGFSAVR